jgi:glycyl-tRNA synthetase beta subunit
MAGARPAIDEFFERILVMHEDRGIRRRRLRLLAKLFDTFLRSPTCRRSSHPDL